jgi:hypothetical protein
MAGAQGAGRPELGAGGVDRHHARILRRKHAVRVDAANLAATGMGSCDRSARVWKVVIAD